MGIGHAINLNNILISNIFILSSLQLFLRGGGASPPIATHSCACYSVNKQIQTFIEVLKKTQTGWVIVRLIINTKLNNTVNSLLYSYSPKVESNGVAFFLQLVFFSLN